MGNGVLQGVYRPRRPRESPLWRVFNAHFDRFEQLYEERFEERYGPLRSVVPRVVRDFLKCGILDWGFARIRCPECRDEYLLAFSCKRRCICPSCHRKNQVEFGEWMAEEVLESVPHRHVVLSVPRRIRAFFLRGRDRCAKLLRAGYQTVRDLILADVGKDKGVPGGVACLQTFGDLLDFHPHVHLMISWGVFARDGTFTAASAVPDAETLEKLFRHKVLSFLVEEEAIDESVVKNMLSWHHTGFGAHVGQEIGWSDRAGRERVASYMAHPPVVVGRILTDGTGDRIIYKSGKIHPRHGANFRVFDPLEFIAEVVAHIPDTHEKTRIEYGWYSNRSRGLRKALGAARAEEAPSVEEEKPEADSEASQAARANWARLIRKVYEVNPLACPRCGTEMQVVAVIDKEPVIRRILSHLGCLGEATRPPPEEAGVRELQLEMFPEEYTGDGSESASA